MECSILKRVFSLVSLLLLFVLPNSSLDVASNSTKEAFALLKWKANLQKHNHSLLTSWTLSSVNSTTISPCTWLGISCNHAGSIRSINLTSTSLTGDSNSPAVPIPVSESDTPQNMPSIPTASGGSRSRPRNCRPRLTPSQVEAGSSTAVETEDRHTSDVWAHFDKFYETENDVQVKKARCKYCENVYKADSTLQLRRCYFALPSACDLLQLGPPPVQFSPPPPFAISFSSSASAFKCESACFFGLPPPVQFAISLGCCYFALSSARDLFQLGPPPVCFFFFSLALVQFSSVLLLHSRSPSAVQLQPSSVNQPS